METIIKSKNFGDKKWTEKTLILPDFCAPYFEKYAIEIVEYHKFQLLSIFVQTKTEPVIDITSYTVHKPTIQENILNGFREVFKALAEIEKTVVQPTEEKPAEVIIPAEEKKE